MTEPNDSHLIKAPKKTRGVVAELVERYQRDADQYARESYKEARVRVEFIDPFFEVLGWDVANVHGYTELYKDVIHEDAIKVRGATKAPDYCFRIGGQRKFFLEAKKPSVHIKTDPSPAYQLRRYAWSAKLPLSILTDFEEFAVYDCAKRPQETDGPAVARVDFIAYDQYLDRLDDIYSIFAKEAILKGSFDRYAEGTRRKRGTTEVDSEFLKEIEAWRELLAKDIARHNPGLSVHDLNFAVQATIDRILFFRIAEDRGVEPYGRLQGLVAGDGLYQRLCELYEQADTKYNAGLFDFSESGDELTLGLQVSDKAVKSILADLYYLQCPYEFSVIGADILGAVYEQFLGKVIRLTPKRYVKVEDKPEVKKAGGVYYTPTYIVDYIVAHTVGEALKEAKTPKKASGLCILDLACGSGSFLLGAYQRLLDWHLDYYTSPSPQKYARGKQPVLVQVREEEWRLATSERKRILLNNIYGVDIDPQAVEVTKLNLLLKCLEGETEQTLAQQLQIFHEPALPNLADNIKCGNSLIGPDYYEAKQLALIDEEEARRVNAFDWDAEFPEIMTAGGFDCVTGNPPYLGGREWTDELYQQRDYFLSHYASVQDQFDLYSLFIEKGLSLLKEGALFGYITPNTWLNNRLTVPLRRFVLSRAEVVSIADYRDVRVFPRATVLPIVVILSRSDAPDHSGPIRIDIAETPTTYASHETTAQAWQRYADLIFNIVANRDAASLVFKLGERFPPLETVACARFGVKVYQKGKGVPPQTAKEASAHQFEADTQVGRQYRRYLLGRDIDRWQLQFAHRWLRYGSHLAEPRQLELFQGSRVLVRRIVGQRLIATYVEKEFIADQLIHTAKVTSGEISAKYLCGLLNSGLTAYFFRNRFNRNEKTFPEIRIGEINQLPIRTIDFGDPEDVARHDKMVELVETMLELHKRLAQVKTPRSRERIQRQIAATDQAIDRLVYELYDLTDEEIAIVEETV